MADKQGISKLDRKLVSDKVLKGAYKADFPLVHRKMNSIIKKTGTVLSDEVFEKGNKALRKWLDLLDRQGASQDKLTAYLRCGLAHLTYDYIGSQYKKIGVDDLLIRTVSSLKNRKLNASFYKPREDGAEATPAKAKAKPKKKIEPVYRTLAFKKRAKKSGAKKPAAKKAVAKKPAKKAAAKKTVKKAAKKSAVKKTIARKPAKKSAVKKSSARKPAAKKGSAKKPVARKSAAKKTPRKAVARKPAKKSSVKKPALTLRSSVKRLFAKGARLKSPTVRIGR
jgi:hypothetical protein